MVDPAFDVDSRRTNVPATSSATGVPFLSVECRYAPEFPAPTPVTDCCAGLQWLVAHAGELGVDPARVPDLELR